MTFTLPNLILSSDYVGTPGTCRDDRSEGGYRWQRLSRAYPTMMSVTWSVSRSLDASISRNDEQISRT